MSRAEVSKLTEYIALGPPADAAVVSKLAMYVVLVPGVDEGVTPAASQAHVYAQKIRRG